MSDLEVKARKLKKNLDIISSHFHLIISSRAGILLSLQEMKVIKFLGETESCIMREISEHFNVALSTTTNVVDKLEEKGFVRRERIEEDRRIVKVFLTPAGQKIFQQCLEDFLKMSRCMLMALSETEQDVYLSLIEKIATGGRQYFEASKPEQTVKDRLESN